MTQEKVEETKTAPDDDSPIYVAEPETEPSTDGQAKEDASDLQTQIYELKGQVAEKDTRIAKQADDLRSTQGQARKQGISDDSIQKLSDEFAGFQAQVMAGFKSLAEGNLDNLPTDMAEAGRPHAIQAQRNSSGRIATARRASFDELLLGEDGNALLDSTTAPELASARDIFDAGIRFLNAGDVAQAEEQFGLAQNEATKVVRVAERKAFKDSLAKQDSDAKESRQKLIEESGVEDMGTGKAGAASTPVEGAELEKGLGDGTIPMTPENQKKYQEYLDQQNFRR
jgi:hypothetical protein